MMTGMQGKVHRPRGDDMGRWLSHGYHTRSGGASRDKKNPQRVSLGATVRAQGLGFGVYRGYRHLGCVGPPGPKLYRV